MRRGNSVEKKLYNSKKTSRVKTITNYTNVLWEIFLVLFTQLKSTFDETIVCKDNNSSFQKNVLPIEL